MYTKTEFAAASGSVEGAIYTTLPIRDQFFSGGMLEVLTQSFLFSVLFLLLGKSSRETLDELVVESLVCVGPVDVNDGLLAGLREFGQFKT